MLLEELEDRERLGDDPTVRHERGHEGALRLPAHEAREHAVDDEEDEPGQQRLEDAADLVARVRVFLPLEHVQQDGQHVLPKVCGVLAAMLQGHSRAPTPTSESL